MQRQILIPFPDDEWFQIIKLFLVSASVYPVHSKTELQSIILTRK